MRDADNDDIVLAGEIGAVVADKAGGTDRVPAAVQPDHDGVLCRAANTGSPHVDVQAVLAHRLAHVERFEFFDENRINHR